MTTIYHPTHPHYAVYKAYVEGCFANPDNPPVLQFLSSDGHWVASSDSFFVDLKYRLKPRTVTRTVTYPAPMRQVPETGSAIWFVSSEYYQPGKRTWTAARWLQTVLKNGMLFATEADAQACYDALFGERK